MLWIAVVVAVALIWWKFRRPATPASAVSPAVLHAPTQRSTAPVAPAAGAAHRPARPPVLLDETPPPDLAAFRWLGPTDLDAGRRDTLMATIQGIPRPPRSMQQLLSPEFVAKASSADLSELVMGEPLIAAKVLSTVNGPFYGLNKPVTNIGQAVTFLGINSVRSICLQYMLAEAFKPKLAESQKAFDAIWKASAIASELAVRLAKALNLPDQGGIATQVVLGFVGQLATASLIPPAGLPQWLSRNRLERARLEQDLLGLSATEIGGLLMQGWELPPSLIADVCDTGRLLVTPAAQTDTTRLPRLALGYLCARLGERLALGELKVLDGYEPLLDTAVDMHHLRLGLGHPALAKLETALKGPELLIAVRLMLGQPTA
jgi:HD-like signal output (HDOD) protein